MKLTLTTRRCLIAFAMVSVIAGLALAAARNPASAPPGVKPDAEREAARTNHPVIVRRPAGPPTVLVNSTNYQGWPVAVSCSSCHTTTQPNPAIRSGEQLEKFHQGLHYAHGSLSCLSCHNADNYDTLRLADGTAVEFVDVMRLCGQCHGPQLRDFERGLHGGMNGHWDLTQGPRTRNNCITCHDPHAPAFPLVQPVFPPHDRLPLSRKAEAAHATSPKP